MNQQQPQGHTGIANPGGATAAAPAPASPTTSALAIAALVVGVLGLCLPGLALIALVLGVIAFLQIGSRPDRVGGKPLAIGAIAIGAGSMLLHVVLLVGILVPALGKARVSSIAMLEQSNMRQVMIAAYAYSADNNGYFPSHPAVLVEQQYAAAEMFVSPFNEGGTPPAVQPIPQPDSVPYRYGDFFFTYNQIVLTERPGMAESVWCFSFAHPEQDGRRHFVQGDGAASSVTRDEFDEMIEQENANRTANKLGPPLDVSNLPVDF